MHDGPRASHDACGVMQATLHVQSFKQTQNRRCRLRLGHARALTTPPTRARSSAPVAPTASLAVLAAAVVVPLLCRPSTPSRSAKGTRAAHKAAHEARSSWARAVAACLE